MQRIGVIADNHSGTVDGSDVPPAVLAAFAGVDLIVHCGDAGSWGTFDRLSAVAPVVGVLGGHNGSGEDERVAGDRRVIDFAGRKIGIVHDFVQKGVMRQTHPAFDPVADDLADAIRSFFGERPDVILYAGTHVPRIGYAGGMFWVNAGSATMPAGRPRGSLGTVAVVTFEEDMVSARVVELAGQP